MMEIRYVGFWKFRSLEAKRLRLNGPYRSLFSLSCATRCERVSLFVRWKFLREREIRLGTVAMT